MYKRKSCDRMKKRQVSMMEKQQNICLLISYDGSRFGGWQRVENGKKPSIQGTLEQVIGEKLTGSGRTDAGVHAWGQTANVRIPASLWSGNSPEGWREEWNRQLPEGLRIREIREVAPDFHSRYDSIGKTYWYLFDVGEVPTVFAGKYAYPLVTMMPGSEWNMKAIREASEMLLGEHDFSAFASKMEPGRGTVRRIDSLEWEYVKHPLCRRGNLLAMKVTGNGFLYHMVRILAGTLVEVGMGKRTPESVRLALESGSRPDAGMTLPGLGLVLYEVHYSE